MSGIVGVVWMCDKRAREVWLGCKGREVLEEDGC